jgi:hypothetical protein
MLAMLTACGFSSSKTGEDGGAGGDSTVMRDASTRFGMIFPVVLSSYPTLTEMVTADLDIDTTPPSSSCDSTITDYCVYARTSFTVAAGRTIRGHGTRPLVLVSTTSFDLAGDIDVSSTQDATPGAGALSTITCQAVVPPPVLATGNSGGFGGSFGGRGSDGDAVNGTRGIASTAATSWPSTLRGGCPGGIGGSGVLGGNGGGAVAIIADSINFNGKINASGAGGRGGGMSKTGGGGGGSGGMIVLDVPVQRVIRGTGVLFASGGGGGEGGTGGVAPTAGQDGHVATSPGTAAAGGASSNDGGDGGDGSYGNFPNGANTRGQVGTDGGGGGGGGGAGMIYAPSLAGDTVIAPPSTSPIAR